MAHLTQFPGPIRRLPFNAASNMAFKLILLMSRMTAGAFAEVVLDRNIPVLHMYLNVGLMTLE